MSAIVYGVCYERRQCDHCHLTDTCRDTPVHGWICFTCTMASPAWHRLTMEQRSGTADAYARATSAIAATEVPVERMLAPADIAWMRGLA